MDQRYRPAKGRANWTTAFLVAHGALIIVSIVSTISEIGLLQRIESGQFVSDSEIDANDVRQGIIGLLYSASSIIAAIAFLRWIHLASKNLAPLGAGGQRFSPGWAVGWWFIPIMWLFRPYQVMAEIWRGSYPETGPDAWQDLPVSPLMGFWWATWLVSGWVAYAAILFFFSSDTSIDGLIMGDFVSIAYDVVSMVSLILVIILIRQITSNQDIKHAYSASVPAPSAPGGGRYCAQCGAARASADARFCTACGAAL